MTLAPSLAAAALTAFSALALAGCGELPIDETMNDVTVIGDKDARATYVTNNLEYRGKSRGFVFGGPGDLVLKEGFRNAETLTSQSGGAVIIEGDQLGPINAKGDVIVRGQSYADITTTGTIMIEGDMDAAPGFPASYKAGGSVTVRGTVSMAQIETADAVTVAGSVSSVDIKADKDITIGNLYFGSTLSSTKGNVYVKGDVGHARRTGLEHIFKNTINAAGDIIVDGHVANTDLVAGGKTDVDCYYKIGPVGKLCPM